MSWCARSCTDFGFSRLHRHKSLAVDHYAQNDLHVFVNDAPGTHASAFAQAHGPCISALGFRVADARFAFEQAILRGAQPYLQHDGGKLTFDLPAIVGIGGSLVYFVDRDLVAAELVPHPQREVVPDAGFLAFDHLTNNVERGTLKRWADFYKGVFGLIEVRTFDIRGQSTGLYSYALRSPSGRFCIPINEGTEDKSQIEEYLREYRGPGIQHVAFLTRGLLGSLDTMDGRVPMLDIDDAHYDTVFDRVPNVTEDRARIRAHQVLVDGDDDGYLLQIFTRNLMGPIFIELIQRKNHHSFGEGNFSALFRSIERVQERRGVL